MTWEEYCIKKKIDSEAFRKSEPAKWEELKTIFEQVHPNSFTEQKKFLINDIRRKYHLKEENKKEEPVKKSAGPAIKIPPKKSN
ncbi:MAG: hypothetical protein K2X86_17235 [Cytophagaceae bacterium]|nr:hypothetical protein [Cytophagaceae bacterium]